MFENAKMCEMCGVAFCQADNEVLCGICARKQKFEMIPVSVRFEYTIGDRHTAREAATHCIPEMALQTIRELFEVCSRSDEAGK